MGNYYFYFKYFFSEHFWLRHVNIVLHIVYHLYPLLLLLLIVIICIVFFLNIISLASPINLDKDPGAVEQLLLFGRELQSLFNQLSRKTQSATSNQQLQTLLQDVFSLLAYADPFSSPVAYLLDPSQREPVTAALNSAILSEWGIIACPLPLL